MDCVGSYGRSVESVMGVRPIKKMKTGLGGQLEGYSMRFVFNCSNIHLCSYSGLWWWQITAVFVLICFFDLFSDLLRGGLPTKQGRPVRLFQWKCWATFSWNFTMMKKSNKITATSSAPTGSGG